MIYQSLPSHVGTGGPSCPISPGTFLVFALRIPHSGKLLSPRQNGMVIHPLWGQGCVSASLPAARPGKAEFKSVKIQSSRA